MLTFKQSEYPMINFPIESVGMISKVSKALGYTSFEEVSAWVRALSYGRNADKSDPLCLLNEQRGTCSTKHLFLKRLAMEQGQDQFRLMIGLYRMNAKNTAHISELLTRHDLPYIPEAHTYLRVNGICYDYTGLTPMPRSFEADLIEETEILPDQMEAFKVPYHQNQMMAFLKSHPHIPYALEQIWQIREECIARLG